ncbi:hypothetical protein [Vogesella oryzae]|uniref:hypothetical protein n=1 Tax=Vogesella oryzae TaxID=1735285 RepID=UPI001583C32F|nr:hypothetical protein [Vogesella oryzae]
MSHYHSKTAYFEIRAEVRSNILAGKPMPRSRPEDIRNANARREIERRRIERESKE